MRILFFVFLISLNLFARGEISVFSGQDEKMQEELKKLPKEDQRIYQNITPSDENLDIDINDVEDPFVPQSSLVLTNDEYPLKVYVNEAFPITIYAKTTENTDFDFKIGLKKNNDLLFLNPDAKWENVQGEYVTTLWFEAKTSNALLKQISIQLLRNGQVFQQANLNLNPIKYEVTPSNNNFAHLIASSLEVKKIKTSNFDNHNVIVMLELNARNTNLKSFYIDGVQKQGVENLKGDFNASSAFYYAILPSSKTNFEFSYFNKDTKSLENMSFKLIVSDDEVSTQSDLNPTNKSFNIYKQYAFWCLTFIFAVLFVWKKNYIIFGLAVVCFILGFFVDTNIKSGILKAGSRAKILPTEPSTYFYTANSNEKVKILGKRLNYVKVLLENSQIGWVLREDLQKN
ncbi:SH3 domain-containing protein [Campylobacter estrildidarum]|uniref:SH3 domain-containing protein n=1 Tax=Campylobacter estrildidarum TaxID=2510189 RepID=A0A4U7BUS1_9BACT|nr:SH3 domain-containing protein [Campylobacter estrildidarum]TKX32147.1 hypothetical protein CQA69_01150 [Campylobacter estrildidarum]